MFKFLRIIKIVAEWIPIIGEILKVFGKTKAQEKAKEAQKIAEAVISGVEMYSAPNKVGEVSLPIKQVIKGVAVNLGTEEKLHEMVNKFCGSK